MADTKGLPDSKNLERSWNRFLARHTDDDEWWSVGAKSWRFFIEVFMQKYVPTMSLRGKQVSVIADRIMARRADQETPFAVFESFLIAMSSNSGSEEVVEQQAHEKKWSVAFDAPFRDPGKLVTMYALAKLDDCANKFYSDSSYYYAPFLPMVQSSGWGKSKLMKHLATQRMIVFYFCLLDKHSTGYPRADPDIAAVFTSIVTQEDAYAIFYACLMWLLEQERLPDAAKFFSQQQSRQWPEGLKQKITQRKRISKDSMQAAFKAVWGNLAGHKGRGLRNNVKIIFVLDEARQLIISPPMGGREMPFTLLRRACSAFCEGTQATSRAVVIAIDTAVVIAIDTFGKVSNLAPTSEGDSSSRVVMRGKRLINPISALPTFNLQNTPQEVQTLEDAAAPLNLFSRGRPLWAAALSQDTTTSVDDLLALARTKLSAGKSKKDFLKARMSCLVVLGRRIAVDVCPQDKVAEQLVASHMQVCLHISPSRESMITTTLPEPVLAEAAASLLRDNRSTRVAKQLKQLQGCILNGQVNAGERGELVARFLLLNTMDELNGSSLTKPQSLEAFLQKLTKGFWLGFKGKDSSRMKASRVFFNAFYPYHGWDPSYAVLQEFVKNAGALVCRQGQPAYDLLIPFVSPNRTGKYDLNDEECIQCLAIQVKNRKDLNNSEAIVEQMHNHAFTILQKGLGVVPTIMLVLQLGVFDSGTLWCCKPRGDKTRSIALEGLPAVHYDTAWKEHLEGLLRERPHPMRFLPDGAKGSVRSLERARVADILKQLYESRELAQPETKVSRKRKRLKMD